MERPYDECRTVLLDDLRSLFRNSGAPSLEPPKRVKRKYTIAKRPQLAIRRSQRLLNLVDRKTAEPLAKLDVKLAPPEAARPQGTLRLSDCTNAIYKHDADGAATWEQFETQTYCTLESEKKILQRWAVDHQDDLEQQILRMNRRERWKLTTSRIYSMLLHSSEEKLLLCAGDKQGNIGFMDWTQCLHGNDDDARNWQFQPHSRPINCLKLNGDGDRLFSCSYDGSLRCFDFQNREFSEVYVDEDDVLKFFDLPNDNELFVTNHFGGIIRLDLRTKKHDVLDTKLGRLRTIDFHENKNYFCVATYQGLVAIFDRRKANKTVFTAQHGSSVRSAFFSPGGGHYCLTSSMDDRIRVWRVDLRSAPQEVANVRHSNHVGRWLTNFEPVWHPISEQLFLTGSMDRPRKMEIYRNTGALFTNLGELATVCSITVWHNSLALICGANSSGYVTLFC